MQQLWQALFSHYQEDQREANLRNFKFYCQKLGLLCIPKLALISSAKDAPLAGFRRPVNKSLLLVGRITISMRVCLALSRPAAYHIKVFHILCKKYNKIMISQFLTNIIPLNSRASVHYCCVYHFN